MDTKKTFEFFVFSSSLYCLLCFVSFVDNLFLRNVYSEKSP